VSGDLDAPKAPSSEVATIAATESSPSFRPIENSKLDDSAAPNAPPIAPSSAFKNPRSESPYSNPAISPG
jgi:hypothetical protein